MYQLNRIEAWKCMFMIILEAEVVLQCLTADWRAGECYHQPLQVVCVLSDLSSSLCLA